MADINALPEVNEDEGVLVHMRGPDGELLFENDVAVEWLVAGTYSTQYKRERRKQMDKQARARGGHNGATADEVQTALEAACVLRWHLTSDGKPWPITHENYKAAIKKQPQWQEQVYGAMTDHEAFFQRS